MMEEDVESESLPLPNAPAEADLDPQGQSSVSTDEKAGWRLEDFSPIEFVEDLR